MSNAPWTNKWQRSPRQDRRVNENGKFVELGKIHDETVIEVPEQEQSALEIVQETPNAPEQEETPNPSVSTADGASVSEENQAELEPFPEKEFDATTAHFEGSMKVADIVEALEPLPGDVLTQEQSDALAETLRLPELTEYDIEARLDQEDDAAKANQS